MADPATATAAVISPRQRIIDAAIACFARDGFHGASMQQICTEAAMSPGALYRYFPSKVSIIVAIAEGERQQHLHFFERLATSDDPIEALASIGLDKLEQILGTPHATLTAEVMAEAVRNPEVMDMFYRNQVEARSHVVAALRRGQEAGTVDPDLDIETACQLIMAMGDGLRVHQGLDKTLTPPRFRPVLQILLRRFLRPPATAVMALALLLLAAVPLRAQPAAATPRPPSVTTVAATTGSIAETAVLTGTLVPREEVLVSPQLEGLAVTELLAEEGDRVQQGQVLARLSRDILDATIAQNAAQIARADSSVAQARSAIAENQANRAQLDLALARTKDLLSNGNASRETFEQRQAAAQMAAARLDANQGALKVAEADLALARAQHQELLVRLDHTDIRAPVAGIISRRTARLGAVVAGAGDPLFRIIQDGAIELEADVPELQLAKLHPGQPATIDTAGGPRPGTVRLVSPEVNRSTRLGRVRVAVTADATQNTDSLVIGSFARAGVEVARRDGVLAPLSAVLFQPGGAVVQVVNDGVVETRPVQVGLRHAGLAEIRQGLAAGETVVSVSGTFIRGGDRVTPVLAAAR
jgi:HlyD family secretion protein